MTSALIITAMQERALPLDADGLNAAARSRWGQAARVTPDDSWATNIHIDEPGRPVYQFGLHRQGDAIYCDGDPDQKVEVAIWVRSLIPDDFPRVIAFEMDWSWHVDLVPGMTEEQFRPAMVDHSVPGWDADDPDLR